VKKFTNQPEMKNRIVYVYNYRGDEKSGVLLTDVVQHAEALQTDDKVFMVVENHPEFPGGFDAFKEYMRSNVKYPTQALEKGENGTVYVSMIVNQDGRISDAKVLRGVSQSLDAEALRVVSSMPPWKPGIQNGKTVRVRFNLPIKFHPAEKQGEYYEVKPATVEQVKPEN
jgi:periplasmic protein TonB